MPSFRVEVISATLGIYKVFFCHSSILLSYTFRCNLRTGWRRCRSNRTRRKQVATFTHGHPSTDDLCPPSFFFIPKKVGDDEVKLIEWFGGLLVSCHMTYHLRKLWFGWKVSTHCS